MLQVTIIVFVIGAAVAFYASHKSEVDSTKDKLKDILD